MNRRMRFIMGLPAVIPASGAWSQSPDEGEYVGRVGGEDVPFEKHWSLPRAMP